MLNRVILILSLLLILNVQADDGWCHLKLKGNNSLRIYFDFQVGYETGAYFTNPLWINIFSPHFNGKEEVTGVLMPWTFDSRGSAVDAHPTGANYTLAFKFENGRYTAPVPERLLLQNGMSSYIHEFAVVIDGQWIKDSRSHANYRFDLYNVHSKNQCYAKR